MSDIVARLRAEVAWEPEVGELMAAAADEIERLRLTDAERFLIQSAVDEWQEHAEHWRDNDERVADEADSNAATLRGLLERTR
jgi:hypothetical protein